MIFTLDIKRKCNFFWLRGIRRVRIDQCCAKCFVGEKYNEVFEKTKFKSHAHVEIELPFDDTIKAYYLCGLSRGWIYDDNTHIAFLPCIGQNIEIDDSKFHLLITDARLINFQSYVPNPVGEFTQEQRACRNWIFANYLQDGMPL